MEGIILFVKPVGKDLKLCTF